MSEVPQNPDIATLFARDPADLTNEDCDAIIQKMRDARHLFATEGKAAKAKAPAKPKLTAKQSAALDIKLDIDLEL